MFFRLFTFAVIVLGAIFSNGCQSSNSTSFGFKWYIAYKDYPRAVWHLRSGLENDTYRDPLWMAMAAMTLAKSEEQLKHDPEALAAYAQSLALKETPDAYYFRGVYYLKKGDLKKSEVDLNKALKLVDAEYADWCKLPPDDRCIATLHEGKGYSKNLIFLRANIFRQTNITKMRGEDFYALLRLSILEQLNMAKGNRTLK